MNIDKVVLAVFQREDADAAVRALNQAGLAVTVIGSTGGFLRKGSVTLLMGLKTGDVDRAIELLKAYSHRRSVPEPRETQVGTAVFVMPVEHYLQVGSAPPDSDFSRISLEPGTMKVILAIVSQQESDRLLKTLTDWSYRGTLMSTTGGFSHRPNATLLIGARSERVDSIVDQIRQVYAKDPQADSAPTILVLDVEQYVRM